MCNRLGTYQDKKKTRRGTGLFKEKVFRFLWGVAKLYNVLGGYIYYNSIEYEKVCTKI